MRVISIAEAKKTLSALIKRAAAGERIEIGAYGQSQVALVSSTDARQPVRPGAVAGQRTLPATVDAPLPDEVVGDFAGIADQSLLRAIRLRARQTGRSTADVVNEALRNELRLPGAMARVCEPLPTYGGRGLQAGVDLSDRHALEDLMNGL